MSSLTQAHLPGEFSLERALQVAKETRHVELGPGVLGLTPNVFRKFFKSQQPLIVADLNTYKVAGEKVWDSFRDDSHACCEPFIFTAPDLYAEHSFVTLLEEALRLHEAIPVAIGAGTINDLTKLAAHRTGRPYMVVATAASMDGYTAFGASITYNGSKQTFSCPAPIAVIADLDVIRSAPLQMNASGYADLLAKTTAGADWQLADALGVEPIQQEAWNTIQTGLRDALDNPAGIPSADFQSMRKLTEGLLLGGFAMQSAQSSRPASGAEHQFSHLWDMQHHTVNGEAPSHGFKVGIGTLAVTALYEQLLTQPLNELDVDRCCTVWRTSSPIEGEIARLLGTGELADKAIEETRAKLVPEEELRSQLETLRSAWPDLAPALRKQLIPFTQVKRMLRESGAPAEPEAIGIDRQRLRTSFWQAYYIRRRFTILDVAVRAGILESSLGEIFGPTGVWPVRTEPEA